ncbi:hypothetical protein NP493_822g01000 [Ridgeia piscesae]|uniref:VWFD domain-containing protein n=1 Tax=Ridgeia piscesae TaxID=27915 RepID=A0AAD9KMR9_RIDPI|nr:hypothetical protein NP493_822g01000 [Ridgeia piscesae]
MHLYIYNHCSHWCEGYITKTEYAEAKCGEFLQKVLEGFDLDRTQSNLTDIDVSELQGLVTKWATNIAASPRCIFKKMRKETIKQCCVGYNGSDCQTPICDSPCRNNGLCISPNTCECTENFVGQQCEDDISEVREDYAYCYTRKSCFGDKPDGMQAVVMKSECCAWGGRGWGLQGRQCEECPDIGTTDFKDSDYSEDKPSVVANDAGLNFRTCYSYGPNYYRTFDGLEYLFPGRCKYTAFSDGARSVMVTMVNCSKYSTCRKILDIKVNQLNLVRAQGGDITVNDKPVNVTYMHGWSSPTSGIRLQYIGSNYYLEYGTMRVRWDDKDTWLITLSEPLEELNNDGNRGLCGNFDGEALNDMKTAAGMLVTNPAAFGNSWGAPKDFGTCPDAPAMSYMCRESGTENKAKAACNMLRTHPFSDCHDTVMVNHYYHRCVNDFCSVLAYTKVTNETLRRNELDAVVCGAFSAYSSECGSSNVIIDWRTSQLCRKWC